MKTVSTTEAKAKLNSLLAEVETGETVTITSRGRPVAVLTKAGAPARKFGQFAGIISVPDDFDAPLGDDEIAPWG